MLKGSRDLAWTVLLGALLLLVGCGGASYSQSKEAAGYPGGAAADMAPAEPESELYANATASTPVDRDEAEEMRVAEAEPMAGAGAPRAAPGPAPAPPPQKAPPADKAKPDIPPPDPAAAGEPAGPGVATTGEKTIASPMLIYTAEVNMAVFETKKAMDAVEKIAKQAGGYLVRRDDRRITVRVPSGKFDGSVDSIAKLGDVLHKNVSVQDVTSEYVDLQIRMRNLEVVRRRLEKLLEKADKVPDAIAVEKELERVTGELERMKGRLKLLTELVHFSTITVEFSPRPTDHVDSKVRLPFPWLDTLGLGELLRM